MIPEEMFMDKIPEIVDIHFGEFVITWPAVLQEIIYIYI